jgi:hypothetical protein
MTIVYMLNFRSSYVLTFGHDNIIVKYISLTTAVDTCTHLRSRICCLYQTDAGRQIILCKKICLKTYFSVSFA